MLVHGASKLEQHSLSSGCWSGVRGHDCLVTCRKLACSASCCDCSPYEAIPEVEARSNQNRPLHHKSAPNYCSMQLCKLMLSVELAMKINELHEHADYASKAVVCKEMVWLNA